MKLSLKIVWVIWILNGFALISFTYFFSFLTTSHGSGQLFIFFFYFLVGTIIVLLFFIMTLLANTRNFAKRSSYFLLLIPCYNVGACMIGVSNRSLFAI